MRVNVHNNISLIFAPLHRGGPRSIGPAATDKSDGIARRGAGPDGPVLKITDRVTGKRDLHALVTRSRGIAPPSRPRARRERDGEESAIV